jgi:ElaB/YqjD/DUF883 family membrane-anchored ribosome-binding protein
MSRINEAVESANAAVDQVKGKAGEVAQAVRDAGSQVRDAATEKYAQVRDQASQYVNDGRQRAEEWEHSLESYVQEKPLQAVLLAAGIGLLLGLIWKRS